VSQSGPKGEAALLQQQERPGPGSLGMSLRQDSLVVDGGQRSVAAFDEISPRLARVADADPAAGKKEAGR